VDVRRPGLQPGSEVTKLFAELQSLRKGTGLTRAKVARADTLGSLPVVRAEVLRLARRPEEIAYHLLIACVHGLKGESERNYLITAFALDHVPVGDGLADRRRRSALDESRVRDHEDEALEEVARWLLEMTDPVVLFGDYFSEHAALPAEWNINTLIDPVAVDEVHPRGEVAWESLESTTTLDAHGLATETETRGILRATVDGATGYTVHLSSDRKEYRFTGIGVRRGGRPGKTYPPGLLNSARVNINFHAPLRLHQTLPVHWFVDLEAKPGAQPVHAWAKNVEMPVRDLTLQVRFHPDKLPTQPCYYVSKPHLLPDAIGPKRPLPLVSGGVIVKTWRTTEIGQTYMLAWGYADAR